jgi:hypothetical protein
VSVLRSARTSDKYVGLGLKVLHMHVLELIEGLESMVMAANVLHILFNIDRTVPKRSST